MRCIKAIISPTRVSFSRESDCNNSPVLFNSSNKKRVSSDQSLRSSNCTRSRASLRSHSPQSHGRACGCSCDCAHQPRDLQYRGVLVSHINAVLFFSSHRSTFLFSSLLLHVHCSFSCTFSLIFIE